MERPRLASSLTGLRANTGQLATAAWCLSRGLIPAAKDWFVEIELRAGSSRFVIEIYAAEWGFAFHHDGRSSWIRVTDIPFVHGRDDFQLLREVAGLTNIGRVLRMLESLHGVRFGRDLAAVRTNIADGEPVIHAWIAEL